MPSHGVALFICCEYLIKVPYACGNDLTIAAIVSEAPYLLEGLTMNDAGRRIEEQYADTGGFTDHLFRISANRKDCKSSSLVA
jgi:hypothetical protein